MEVLLKKTKITSNIVKQSERASFDDILKLDVLGWCRLTSAKSNTDLIILYKDGELRKYKEAKLLHKNNQLKEMESKLCRKFYYSYLEQKKLV